MKDNVIADRGEQYRRNCIAAKKEKDLKRIRKGKGGKVVENRIERIMNTVPIFK